MAVFAAVWLIGFFAHFIANQCTGGCTAHRAQCGTKDGIAEQATCDCANACANLRIAGGIGGAAGHGQGDSQCAAEEDGTCVHVRLLLSKRVLQCLQRMDSDCASNVAAVLQRSCYGCVNYVNECFFAANKCDACLAK